MPMPCIWKQKREPIPHKRDDIMPDHKDRKRHEQHDSCKIYELARDLVPRGFFLATVKTRKRKHVHDTDVQAQQTGKKYKLRQSSPPAACPASTAIPSGLERLSIPAPPVRSPKSLRAEADAG